MTAKTRNWLYLVLVGVACLVATRGFFRAETLAGHDSAAYPVTASQFHESIKNGVWFPRWAGDMRFGYGHPILQYRPPAFQYLTECFYWGAGNFRLSINLSVIALVFVAGFGARAFAATFLRPGPALVVATAYVTCNYLLADIYLRGAYYEVAAYAFMPWVLWSQAAIFRDEISPKISIAIAGVAWVGVICGHPQIAAFFTPLALTYAVYLWSETRNGRKLFLSVATFVCGVLISAPYVYVSAAELPYVRMEVFYCGLETYYRHFISVERLFSEAYPKTYANIGWMDYLRRPRILETRALDLWVWLTALALVGLWFGRRFAGRLRRRSLFFAAFALATVVMALPVSSGIWNICSFTHTFNFPWRSLTVTALCLAVLIGTVLQASERFLPPDRRYFFALVLTVVALLCVNAYRKSGGWPGEPWLNSENFTPKEIRSHSGIPVQYYTPTWVGWYATGPAAEPVRVLEGDAKVSLAHRAPTRWTIDIDAKSPARIGIEHYFYPGWKILEEGEDPVLPTIVPPRGTMAFGVAPGKRRVSLVFGSTPERTTGNALFVAGVLALLSLAWRAERVLGKNGPTRG